MLATAVKEISAGCFVERVKQQRALRVSSNGYAPQNLEVFPRVLFRPARTTGRWRLQSQGRPRPVARNAPGVAGALRHEDRLHFRLEVLVIEGGCGCLLIQQCGQEQRHARSNEMHEASLQKSA